jgi:hypothetical protein
MILSDACLTNSISRFIGGVSRAPARVMNKAQARQGLCWPGSVKIEIYYRDWLLHKKTVEFRQQFGADGENDGQDREVYLTAGNTRFLKTLPVAAIFSTSSDLRGARCESNSGDSFPIRTSSSIRTPISHHFLSQALPAEI